LGSATPFKAQVHVVIALGTPRGIVTKTPLTIVIYIVMSEKMTVFFCLWSAICMVQEKNKYMKKFAPNKYAVSNYYLQSFFFFF
jgi:hypothetical protein